MSIELDLTDDGRHDLGKFWYSVVPANAQHIVIHMRNAADIDSLIDENNALRDHIKKLQQDIYSWSTLHVKYQEALDDLRELRKILKAYDIPFDFRSLS